MNSTRLDSIPAGDRRHLAPMLGVAMLVATALPAHAQGPKPAGTFGFELVVEEVSPAASDILTVISLQGLVSGAQVAPLLQYSLDADLNNDGILDIVKVNGAENGTTWQVRTAPEMVIAFDSVLGGPIVFIPARGVNLGNVAALSYVDFRFGLPATVGGLLLAGGQTDIPLQLLDDGAGRIYAVDSTPGFAQVISEITYGGAVTPALSGAQLVSGVDAEFQDRMALGADGTSIYVPHANGVDVFMVPGLLPIPSANISMPTSGGGQPYLPYTNIIAGLPGPYDMMLFGGLPTGGHTYVSWSSAMGATNPNLNGGTDPAGPGLRPAPGFHEPVFTATGPGVGTVTALLDSFPFGGGVGAILQVQVGPAGPTGFVSTPVISPFGDPEATRNGVADPIAFQSSLGATDFFGAVTAGAAGPVGFLSGLVPLGGLINPGDSPRPLAMSLAGFPGSDFALTTSIGATNVELFTVVPGPFVTAVTPFAVSGGASSLGRVYSADALGGPLPAHFQQCAGAGGGINLQVGAPLAVPPITFLAATPALPPPLVVPAMPVTGFVGVPAPQASAATVTAARTSLNFTVVNDPNSWVTLHPSPGNLPPARGVATIASAAFYGQPAAWYAGGAFVMEFASY